MKTLRLADGDLINHWYIAALSKEVKVGKPISRTVYDMPYVLWRGDDGAVSVFWDRCLHRGAKLSEGKCETGLRCPYHGWVYDREGNVVEVPSEGSAESEGADTEKLSKKRNWRLPQVPVFEQDGAVWIWPGDLEKRTASPTWRFPENGNPKWAQYFMITDFDNEVTHLVQNFMDVPHTVFVHDKWFRKRSALKVPIWVDVGDGRVKVTYHQTGDKIGFVESILNPTKAPMIHTDEYIFPNLTRVDYSFGPNGFIINSQCTPVSRYKTRVYTWIAYNVGVLTKPLKPFMQFYTRQVIEQDVDIMANQGPNLKTFEELGLDPVFTADNGFRSTGADELHLAIDKMRAQGVLDRAKPTEAKYFREREFWI